MDHQHISIELHGGPVGGRVWTGPAVPSVDGYPIAFSVTTEFTILAAGFGVVPTAFELALGHYAPTGETCGDGNRIYVWEMPDARWN